MNDDKNILLLDIKKNHKLSLMSLFGVLGVNIFGGFLVLLIIAKQWLTAMVIFCLLIVSVLLLILRHKSIKDMKREQPYKILINQPITYDYILNQLSAFSTDLNSIKISDNQMCFKIKKKFNYRVLITQIEDFSKKEYDSLKRNANKKYNAEFHPKQWISIGDAHRRMRINIISPLRINDELDKYISRNSAQLLRHGEGIINFVMYDNTILIPPLYGDIDFAEVDRYKKA